MGNSTAVRHSHFICAKNGKNKISGFYFAISFYYYNIIKNILKNIEFKKT